MIQTQRDIRVEPFCVFRSQMLDMMSLLASSATMIYSGLDLPLFLCSRGSHVLLRDHTEPAPEIVTLLPASRQNCVFRIRTHDGLGCEFDIARGGG